VSGAILVIEDDTATVELIHEALEAEGHTVLHASGAAGLALARVALPAVILLDINMPGMDGPEVSRLLRADPRTARVPIVCMSSHVARGGIPMGMVHDDCLAKPFALDDLYATVARWRGAEPVNRADLR
jgi:CheY-like chemotaxis protein